MTFQKFIIIFGIIGATIAVSAARTIEAAGVEARWQRLPSATCSTSSTTVLLNSAEMARAVGLEFAQIKSEPLQRIVERNAEVAYNANKYARLSSRAPGVVTEVLVDLGQSVKKGEVLAIIDSSDLGSAKSDLLLALETSTLWQATAARKRSLANQGVGLEREALEAEMKAAESRIEVNRARQRLRTLGLAREQIDTVERDGDTSSLLDITAPFDGLIVERSAVMGEVAESGRPVLAIADTGVMWAMVDLVEADLALVRTGQSATVAIDGLPNDAFPGRVTWISTQIDPKTRTLKARVELDNGSGLLRANMFGRARIVTRDTRQAITIPKDAVQWEGCCNIAFVKDDAQGAMFRPVRLTLAFDAGDRYEVLSGLSPGDTVVTKGSFVLKNEILKSSIGAGCCEVEYLDK